LLLFSKHEQLDGLIAGTTFIMQLCGLDGNTGQSDWSEPVTKIAIQGVAFRPAEAARYPSAGPGRCARK
jgi:hypothetical protein